MSFKSKEDVLGEYTQYCADLSKFLGSLAEMDSTRVTDWAEGVTVDLLLLLRNKVTKMIKGFQDRDRSTLKSRMSNVETYSDLVIGIGLNVLAIGVYLQSTHAGSCNVRKAWIDAVKLIFANTLSSGKVNALLSQLSPADDMKANEYVENLLTQILKEDKIRSANKNLITTKRR